MRITATQFLCLNLTCINHALSYAVAVDRARPRCSLHSRIPNTLDKSFIDGHVENEASNEDSLPGRHLP